MSSLFFGFNLDFEVENIGGSGCYFDVGLVEIILFLLFVIELGDKWNVCIVVWDLELDLVEY